MKLTIHSYQLHEALEQFRSTIHERNLRFLASELMDRHLMDYLEIQRAIKRAMIVCKTLDLPIEAHFKPLYVSRSGQVLCDWKLSDLGRKLVLINGNPANPFVAMLQKELIP